jgi:hypothetical protein
MCHDILVNSGHHPPKCTGFQDRKLTLHAVRYIFMTMHSSVGRMSAVLLLAQSTGAAFAFCGRDSIVIVAMKEE